MIVIKIILSIALVLVFIQDIKERQVYWFLFPIVAWCSGMLLYQNTLPQVFYTVVTINFIFISLILGVVYLYTVYKLKKPISETFGLGDGLLFFAFVFSFSSISFIILFVFSLVFSLLLHVFLKRKSQYIAVPLAGYMSLFFAIAYGSHWFGILESVYRV